MRTTWSGTLKIYSPIKAHIAIAKASEPYRGKEDLRELCECCHQPFTRQTVCNRGRKRLTDTMIKKGETENTTSVVKGVEVDKDEYAVIAEDALKAITDAGTSDVIEITDVVDAARVPLERANGLYYLQPDGKVKGEDGESLWLLYATLERAGKVAIAKWAPRGREQLVAIRPINGVLALNVLLFQSEVRDPDESCLLSADLVKESEIEMASRLFGSLPGTFDFKSATDAAVAVRKGAIKAARNGDPIPTREPDADPETTQDLMAALEALTRDLPTAGVSARAAGNGDLAATH